MDRGSLKKYYEKGGAIRVQGIYSGPAKAPGGIIDRIPYSINEEEIPENALIVPITKKGLVIPMAQIPENTSTSCLTEVIGVDEFDDINESHVIFQVDIKENVPIGDEIEEGCKVEISGYVVKYTRADKTEDYGIIPKTWRCIN